MERIVAAEIRLLDENGPRGGLDKRCRIVVELVGGRQIVANGLAEDAYDAVSRAAARLNRQVRRTVSRGKELPALPRALPVREAPVTGLDGPSRPRVTVEELAQLRALIDAAFDRDRDAAEALDAELERAEVVGDGELSDGVVRLGSRVRYEDEQTGERREVTLVIPSDADATRGLISVLAPIGAALFGLAAGDSIEWPLPGGRSKRLRIVAVSRASLERSRRAAARKHAKTHPLGETLA